MTGGREPLPIDPLLPGVADALRAAGTLILTAPPGSGKTTRVPLALLGIGCGSVLVLEPRRLVARMAASRVAFEIGEDVGGMVGYRHRGARRAGPRTRICFVTEGVLVRQLVRDPFLEGVSCIVLDEFHERHIEGDLAIAMLQEVRATVRPDLALAVMSATLDPAPLEAFLPGAPRIESGGRLFPVRIEYESRRADVPLEILVRSAVTRALEETAGDVLVFLPGRSEIRRCAGALSNLARRSGSLVLPLHGRLSPREQDLAVRPQASRKVVLSTNVAESSITIPGVTAVVDSGLARVLRRDEGRGVDVLRVERIGKASAEQRAGRAGRTQSGVCYRLWTEGEQRGLPEHDQPEIHRVDLAGPSLLVRAFAGRDPRRFAWFEAPSEASLAAADRLLSDLGALSPDGRITEVGDAMIRLPLHPRLARLLVEGVRRGRPELAAEAAAFLSEFEGPFGEDGANLLDLLDGIPDRRLVRARDRLLSILGERKTASSLGADADADLVRCLLAAYPDRVAVRTEGRRALMANGRGLDLPPAADGEDLILALCLFETGRRSRSLVELFVPLAESFLSETGALVERASVEVDEDLGKAFAVRTTCYRDLPIRVSRGGDVDLADAQRRLLPLLRKDPWRWLSGDARELRRLAARLAWISARIPGEDLPGGTDEEIARVCCSLLSGSDLRALRASDVRAAILSSMTVAQRSRLDRLAPDRIALPSGRRAIVDYAAERGPSISARLQEFFGLAEVPALAGGRIPVVLQILAPNHRPIQITTDLSSFWANVYPRVRRELGRRYPRHSWPEDPLRAEPESRPGRRKGR
ncbi:MAG: ATP-dependent helicase HrpB [Planctomycetota bacterium]